MEPTYESMEALERASVVIDCTPSGVGIANKNEFYSKFTHNTRGFIAQGSEFGFGKPYARGINDGALARGRGSVHPGRLLQHAQPLDPDPYAGAARRRRRRTSSTAASSACAARPTSRRTTASSPRPRSASTRTRASERTTRATRGHLFNTMGYDMNLFSSAVVLNTQYMHMIFFDIRVKNPTTTEAAARARQRNDRMAITYKSSANTVFSFGRDYGHFGRILNVDRRRVADA